jgi:predicted small lipoprotein YifL
MRRSRRTGNRGALCVIGVAVLVPALAACGSSSGSSSSTTSTGSTTSTSSNATTATTSGGTTASACAASALAISLDTNGSGTAGSVYYTLKFKNTSSQACTLAGYPGASGVNASGGQLGSAAGRNATTAANTVTLAGGASATSTLQVTEVGNFTASTCQPTTAAGLRVFAPNQTASTRIAFSFGACAKAGPVYLHVTPVVAVGSSGGGGVVATPTCTTPELAIRLGTNGSGAAGSTYYPLNFTNRSGHPCTLTGYPGVSAVNGSGGQLGSAAGRNTSTAAKALTLANGATATSTLQIADVGNYPTATCQPTTAAGLRVYAPNQTSAVRVAFSFSACAKAGPVYLHVSAVG